MLMSPPNILVNGVFYWSLKFHLGLHVSGNSAFFYWIFFVPHVDTVGRRPQSTSIDLDRNTAFGCARGYTPDDLTWASHLWANGVS